MPRYSEERKQAILSKLLPPLSLSVAEVSRSEGIGLQTLYNWRAQAIVKELINRHTAIRNKRTVYQHNLAAIPYVFV